MEILFFLQNKIKKNQFNSSHIITTPVFVLISLLFSADISCVVCVVFTYKYIWYKNNCMLSSSVVSMYSVHVKNSDL